MCSTLVHRGSTYDDPMAELPVSVRVALWATASWRDSTPLDDLWQNAAPDLDAVGGDVDRLRGWRDLGESAVLVALPASGQPRGLPPCAPEVRDAAILAGEALVAPSLGGLLVPSLSTFGAVPADPAGAPSPRDRSLDLGWRVDWTAHDAAPVPVHRVAALDPRQARRDLLAAMAEATDHLTGAGPAVTLTPGRATREGTRSWSLPHGIPGDVLDLLTKAAMIEHACSTGLATAGEGVSMAVSSEREQALRRLRSVAEHVLEEATNVAVAVLAGWRPA